jgi:N-acyl-D-aspartate/D-glutamate deacylase
MDTAAARPLTFHPMRRVHSISLIGLTAVVATSCQPMRRETTSPQGTATTLITNVSIFDGLGGTARRGSVRVAGQRIVGIGALKARAGDTIIDGGGLGLAPGFIDIHSHADRDLRGGSDALGALSQGVTTLIVGHDGNSEFPLDLFLERLSRGSPVNVASFVGYNTLRTRAMSTDQRRSARSDEIGKMRLLLDEELAAGGFGLSTDVRSEPAGYPTKDEIVAVARNAGVYVSRLRDDSSSFWSSVDEILEIARRDRLFAHVSQIRLETASRGNARGLVNRFARLSRGDMGITADVSPYPSSDDEGADDDVETMLKWRWTSIGSGSDLEGGNPRAFGAITRLFAYYVRERRIATVGEAIRKLTRVPATTLGLRERGMIELDMFADLVLLDTAAIADRATVENPRALSAGVAKVWVNGVLAFDAGAVTGAKAGKALR